MIKKLCIISSYYPSQDDPYYAFVGTLVEAIGDMGVECKVISPCSWIEKKHIGKTRIEYTNKGNRIEVFCPRYFIFPNRNICGYKTYKLTLFSKNRAIWNTFSNKIKECDAIYSHFIDSGVSAALLSMKTGIPAFMACGESNIYSSSLYYEAYREILKENLCGIIAVSTELKNNIVNIGIVKNKSNIQVIPNGIDDNLFHVKNKNECRENKGYSKNDFIIAFVGGFINRKGFDTLQEIISKHKMWKCILIGNGDIPVIINTDQVLFCGRLSHNKIPEYLNCADVFVLPTLEEGCCNAIIEAMGCGLPIISSNKEFNFDILNPDVSILVDPTNKADIESAIEKLYTDIKLRDYMSYKAREHSKNYSIRKRADKILSFINNRISMNKENNKI